jgi:hypothetical protein
MLRHGCLESKRIAEIWRRVRPTPQYFEQLKGIDTYFERNPATQWIKQWWHGKEFSRVICLLDFHRWSLKHGFAITNHLLVTDPNDPELRFMRANSMVQYVHQPEKLLGDLHLIDDPSVRDLFFDFVLFSQTLEHLYDPFLCLVNIRAKMRVGGLIFTSVPTVNHQHMTPHHFFHYTPMGLTAIMHNAGFEVLELGQYGSWQFENNILGQLSWADYHSYVRGGILDIDPQRPDNIWVLARAILSG